LCFVPDARHSVAARNGKPAERSYSFLSLLMAAALNFSQKIDI
jgi:hypothetical protein